MIFIYDFYRVPGGKINQGHLHSTYIQIAVDRGILAGICFFVMLFVYFLFFIKNYFKMNCVYLKYILLGGACFLIVFSIFILTEYAFADNEVAMMFWSILGLSVAGIYNNRLEKKI